MDKETSMVFAKHGEQIDFVARSVNEVIQIVQTNSKQILTNSKMLEKHGRILEQHSQILEKHSETLDDHTTKLDVLSEMVISNSKKLDRMATRGEMNRRFDEIVDLIKSRESEFSSIWKAIRRLEAKVGL